MRPKSLQFLAENRTWVKIALLALILLVAAVEPALAGKWGPDWCDCIF